MRGTGVALFLLLAAAGPARPPGTWSAQAIAGGATPSLNAVQFFTPNQGFAVGAAGSIVRTLDAGLTNWTVQTSGTTTALNGVGFGSASVGCAAGDGGLILRTANGSNAGGSAWAPVTTGTLAAVGANSGTNGWTAGVAGVLRQTTDGGTTWPLGNSGSPGVAARGMSFLTAATEGYWVGEMGTVMITSDGVSWAPTGGSGTTNALNAISMVASGTPGSAAGWLAGDGGVIRKTVDSGGMWTNVNSGTTQNLNGIDAADATHAWAVGNNGVITATSNGTIWVSQPNPAGTTALNAVSFFSATEGIVVGAGGTVLRTTNGGMLWNTGTSGTTAVLRGVKMLSATDAVAVGDGGVLLRTVTGGASWSPVSATLTTQNLLAVAFGSATEGWAVGANGTILRTTTGGTAWTVQVGGTSNQLRDVKFGDANLAVAVGAGATILRSTTGGAQWAPVGGLDASWSGRDINAVAFGSATRAVAVGAGGGVLVTTNGGTSWATIAPSTTLTEPLVSVAMLTSTLFVAVGGGAAGAAATISFDTSSSTWTVTVSTTPPTSGMRGVAFAPFTRAGYAVGDGGAIYTTTDAGTTWISEVSGTVENLKGASAPYLGKGWAVGSNGTIRLRALPVPPLLSFPPHVGTPHTYVPPLIDGFVNPELTEGRRPDTGWDRALELTYADGTSQPPLKFMGLRRNSGTYLYLSFEMRGDTAFDDNDMIVLLFRGDNPTPRPDHAANDRRIIINPVATGTGAPTSGTIVAPPPNAALNGTNRENSNPRTLTSYRWDTGTGAWVAIPASTEINCKVRSWIPGGTNHCWSVEIQVPIVATTYTDWITIGTDFLFSFYVLRVQTGGVIESSWPRDLAIAGATDAVDAPLPAYDWGTAKLGSATDGSGVRIQVPSYQNIGVTSPSTGTTLKHQINGTDLNTFHVWVQNNSGTPAPNVRPTFRIADWGVQSGDATSGAWRITPSDTGAPNPPAAQTIPANTGTSPVEFSFTWQLTSSQKLDYAIPHDHQCILVTLDSTSNVDFVERSAWVNMDYVPASRFDRPASVSAKGYGHDGARGGAQRFYLHTTSERFDYAPGQVALDVVKPPDQQEARSERKDDHPYYSGENLRRKRLLDSFPGLASEKTPVSHYTWLIHAVKETSKTVKIRGTTYPILEQATGFGYVARHGNSVDEWASGLSGAIVTKLNEFEYQVDVPVNGSASLASGLEAKEGGGTGLGGLLGLILLILLFLLIIFWFLKKQP